MEIKIIIPWRSEFRIILKIKVEKSDHRLIQLQWKFLMTIENEAQ